MSEERPYTNADMLRDQIKEFRIKKGFTFSDIEAISESSGTGSAASSFEDLWTKDLMLSTLLKITYAMGLVIIAVDADPDMVGSKKVLPYRQKPPDPDFDGSPNFDEEKTF